MKILLINHYAGSIYHGMEFRPYYLSREWVRMGHEVTIAAASFSHLRQQNIEMDAPVKEEFIDGIRYVWLKTPSYSGNGIGRIKNMLSFLYKLYRYENRITRDFNPDAVIASSTYPLDSYPANWMAKKHGAKFVFELHDLWPMSPMVFGGMSKWHPFILVMQMAENYWCRNADLVVSLLPDAYKHLVKHGMSIDKYTVIPNGISPDEWSDSFAYEMPDEHAALIGKLKSENKFIVAYLGGHGLSNGLDQLIEVADMLRKDTGFHFLFVGKGPYKENIKEKAAALSLRNVSFLPPVPKKAVPALLKEMSVLTCRAARGPLCQYGMSMNKVFDYMTAGKPILMSSDASNDLITEARCGYTIPSDDAADLTSKLIEMKEMGQTELNEMGANGKEYVLRDYTYSILAEKYIKKLTEK